jgi:sigma-B regulation protein RsbU (phosphoserine phosphatase)
VSTPTSKQSMRWKRPDAQDLIRVLEITRQMAAESDLVKLLNLIIERTTEVMRADRTSLFLLDREKNECWSKIAQGAEIAEIRFPIGVGIAGDVAATGNAANIPDAYEDARFNKAFDKKTGYRTRSVLCVPLRNMEGEVVGVIQVLNKKNEKPFSDYDEYLLSTLGAQAGVTLTQARLMETYVEAQKLQQEMNLARQIQRNLLPDKPPDLPGYDIAAYCESADETGGDYYDFLDVPGNDNLCGIAIGDVSGHGLAAALVMVQARAILRSVFSGENIEPSVVRMNDLLCPDLEDSRFMTFFLGVLEMEPRRFHFTNAGHEPPLLIRPGAATPEERVRPLDAGGLLLGVMEETEYPEGEPQDLESGDLLFLCTDGVFEARNPAEELYGEERMINALLDLAPKSAKEIVQGVVDRVLEFADGVPLADDLTLVIIRVT